jgi:pyruvate/2-oxoglutarate dehydrogenase complex dihydrolipoamide acyltransferase (E2) component
VTESGGTSTELPAGYEDVPHDVVRLRPRRRAIARNLEEAARIPSLTADVQVDMSAVLQVRADWDGAQRPSVMAFVVKAAADALRHHPSLNASYGERQILQWSVVNISVAVDTPDGLVVPVLRDVASSTVEQIAGQVAELAERARTGGLALEDMAGGTFTVSNPGAVGPSLRAEALLNPPQVALLGLPGMKRVPIVVGSRDTEAIEIRSVLCPSLTFDHRALDGGEAVRFLVSLRDRLQTWAAADYRVTA